MTLRINTNIAALNAHQNMINNDNAMTNVLQQLSSGLRINKAADDASGMAIADSLKSQSLGLGQAVKNANDGISMVQTADGALAESINIVNTIKTKSIQAAQDGQTTDSRKAIQSDITKLLQELDAIAKTTSFNGQKLLSGNFTNKQFQVGAYSGETVAVSIGSAESTKLGQISTTNLTFGGTGTSQLNLYSNLQNKTYTLASQDIQYDNSSAHGLGAVADAINKLSDVLGISAQANVASTTTSNVAAGTTDASFAINGVNIGAVVVSANDSTGALVNAINAKTDQHGVLASVDSAGNLTLSSTDGRAIQVTQGVNTTAVLGGTTNMSTLGTVQLTQTGTGQISVTDAKGVAAMTVSTADGSIRVDGKTTASDESSVLAAGSVLLSGSIMGSGTVLVGTFKVGTDSTATTKVGSVIAAGSVLASGSKIGSGTVLTGQVGVQTDLTAKKSSGGLSSSLVTGSFLSAGTSLVSGAIFQGDVSKFLSGSAAGAITVKADGNTYISGGTAVVKTGGLTLTAGAILGSGASTIKAHSILLAGSVTYGGTITTEGLTTLNANMAATKGFVAAKTSILTTGTQFVTGTLDVNGTLTGDMTLAIGSRIQDLSLVANGSTLSTADSLKLKDNETVGPKDMVLAMGSKIASGSILKAGTVLTADVHERVNASGTGGNLFKKGTTLERDIITSGTTTLTSDMTIKAGSMLFKGTTLGDGFAAKSANTDSSTSGPMAYRLSDINVTSQAGAQIGINVADAALKGLDKVRSDLGSVQNQLTSTISNLSATQVNITSAESSIRDTDFAEASSTFSRMQILVQAGSFAMAQSNASSKSVLSLLQG